MFSIELELIQKNIEIVFGKLIDPKNSIDGLDGLVITASGSYAEGPEFNLWPGSFFLSQEQKHMCL